MSSPRRLLTRSKALVALLFLLGVGGGAAAVLLTRSSHPQDPPSVAAASGTAASSSTTTRSSGATGSEPSPSAGSATTAKTGGSSAATGSASTGSSGSAVPPTPRAGYTSVTRAGTAASFTRLEQTLPGTSGVAVAPLGLGPVRAFGRMQVGHAWSTMKVPVLVTYMRHFERDGRPLSSADRTNATLALEQSDNTAINEIFSELEGLDGGLVPASEDIQRTLVRGGDDDTHVNSIENDLGFSTFGQTEWSIGDEVLFYRTLARGCLLDSADNAFVTHLLEDVIPSERWGAGMGGFPSDRPLAFKGGWGPEGGSTYLVRQTAIVGSGDRGYVLSMLTEPGGGATDSSFVQGQQNLTAIATWARRTLNLDARRPAASCPN
jgi:hypothetical protein